MAEWSLQTLGRVSGSLKGVVTNLSAGLAGLALDSDKERVDFVAFSTLEYRACTECPQSAVVARRVLLLGYATGFQVWDLEENRSIPELVSRRDGPVRFLEMVPEPDEPDAPKAPLYGARPLLAVVPGDAPARAASPPAQPLAGDGGGAVDSVALYSLRKHCYARELTFGGRVLAVRASRRLLVVALEAQLMAVDARSLACAWSVVTFPVPRAPGPPDTPGAAVPLALGARWLAYAANQGVQAVAGCVLPQALSPAGGRGYASSSGRLAGYIGGYAPAAEAVGAYAAAAARSGGRQLRVLGEASFKAVSARVSTWRGADSSLAGGTPREDDAGADGVAGTVMVRDVATRGVVAHFRAHTAPLALLAWDAAGALLVTASVHGHSINVFQVCPAAAAGLGGGAARPSGAVHLFKLARGLTQASIRSVALSACGSLLTATSARGTTHLFRVALPADGSAAAPHLMAPSAPGAPAGASFGVGGGGGPTHVGPDGLIDGVGRRPAAGR
ncbi:hypothetical protein WJX81_002840 [Elliptochloris bilobata]|uniref:BCAS3 WD40 domain-containing protein n=1 Tax=Elliptochloris bilobata TaxID=381761 RepID=A0AAW1SHL0_9CHLO